MVNFGSSLYDRYAIINELSGDIFKKHYICFLEIHTLNWDLLTAFVIANVVQSTIWGRQGILKVKIMLYGKLISVLLGTYYVKKPQGQWYPYISSHGYIVFLHDTIAVLVFPLFSVWILLYLLSGMHFMKCRINHINSKCFQLDSFDYKYLHVQASGVQILMLLISMFYIWLDVQTTSGQISVLLI